MLRLGGRFCLSPCPFRRRLLPWPCECPHAGVFFASPLRFLSSAPESESESEDDDESSDEDSSLDSSTALGLWYMQHTGSKVKGQL